jgi:hypothetical protein
LYLPTYLCNPSIVPLNSHDALHVEDTCKHSPLNSTIRAYDTRYTNNQMHKTILDLLLRIQLDNPEQTGTMSSLAEDRCSSRAEYATSSWHYPSAAHQPAQFVLAGGKEGRVGGATKVMWITHMQTSCRGRPLGKIG